MTRARISTRSMASTRPTNSVAWVIGRSSAATVPTGMAAGCCAWPDGVAMSRPATVVAQTNDRMVFPSPLLSPLVSGLVPR